MVPRIRPLGRGANRANRIIKSNAKGKGAAERFRAIRPAASGQFQLQMGLISETMQQTADDPGLAPAAVDGFDCPWTEAISSAGSATRYSDSGQKE